MKLKIFIGVTLSSVIILLAGCGQNPELNYCDNHEWVPVIPEDNETYNLLNEKEQTFSGTLIYQGCPEASSLMRCNHYKLNDREIYTGNRDLSQYVEYEVEILGKKNNFELEGQDLDEIWPVKIRCK